MKKKIISLILAAVMMSSYSVGVKAATLSEVVSERMDNQIIFTGVSSDKNAKMMLKVYHRDYGSTQVGGFVFFDTVKTDESGRFKVTISMPDTLINGNSATGEYIMSYSGVAATESFMYAIPQDAADIYEHFANDGADALLSGLLGELSEDAKSVGVDMNAFSAISEENQRKLINWFAGMRVTSGAENVNILNDCIYAEYLSVCPENERTWIVANINPSHNGNYYETLSTAERNVVVKYMASVTYAEYTDVAKAFGTGCVLSKLSFARASEISGILADNVALLGLVNNDAYKTYIQMSDAKKFDVNEKMVAGINGSVTSLAQLKAVILSAVNAVISQVKPGGSGSGSGSYGGSSSSLPIVTDGDGKYKEEVFTDLEDASWAREAIEYLAKNKVVAGYTDGRFGPNDNVTREAFVKMLLDASGLFEKGYTSAFSDVVSGAWYAEYVACAESKNIVSGVSADRFGVGETLTRQDMAVIIVRALEMQGREISDRRAYEDFSDKDMIADYAMSAVEALYCANLINGMGDGSFAPSASLTRAQAAKVIYDVYSGALVIPLENSVQGVTATGTTFTERAQFLEAVGVLEKSAAEYRQSDSVTLGQFVNMALNLAIDSEYTGSSITDAASVDAGRYGIVASSKNETKVITVDEAAEIIVKAIGYSPLVAESQYAQKAREIGIFKGLSVSGDMKLTAEVALKMLENATECSPVVVSDFSMVDKGMSELSGATILSHSKDIYKYVGTVTGNRVTTLYSPTGLADNLIEIENTLYRCENDKFGDYLGHRVTYYVDKSGDEEVVKYAKLRDREDTTVIDADDFIDISDNFGVITYYKNESTKTLKINGTPRVFYNGRFYGEYEKADFDIDSGNITVVEAYNRDDSDMIFITSYETFIVDRVSTKKTEVFNKYTYEDATDKIDFEDTLYTIIKNGEEIGIGDLKAWDILSVAATKNGSEPSYTIYVSDTVETGKTEEFSPEDRTVESIGYVYDVAGSYFDSWALGRGVGTTIKLGEYQVYHLDVFGRIVAVEKDITAVTDAYAYVVKIFGDGENFEMRYFDMQEGEVMTLPMAKEVRINGIRCKNSDKIYDSELYDADGNYVRQLIKYTVSDKREIAEIETATLSTDADPALFTMKSVSTSYTYENASFNHEMFLNSDAKILCVPNDSDSLDDYYVVDRSLFTTDKAALLANNVMAFNFDDFSRTSLAVVTYNKSGTLDLSDSLEMLVVDGVKTGLNKDFDVMKAVTGSIGNYQGMKFLVEDGVLTDVEEGDVLYVRFNSKGRISHGETKFSLSQLMEQDNIYESAKLMLESSRNSRNQLCIGWVTGIDMSTGTTEDMVMLDSTVQLPVRMNGNLNKVVVYDAEDGKTSVEDIGVIEKGDLMIVRMRYSVNKAIVVIKNIRR